MSCCKNCKDGKRCASKDKEKAWLEVYKKGLGASRVPFRGLGQPKPTPKGCKTREMHARTLTGKKFNYAGPGTCFSQRRARGDKPITYSDGCAVLHDYQYNRKDATRDEIKRADDDFRRCVKAAPNKRFGDSINKFVMTNVFKGKRLLEKTAGLNPLRGTDSKSSEKKSHPKALREMHVKKAKSSKRRPVRKPAVARLKAASKEMKISAAVPRPDRLYANQKWEARR